MRKPAFAHGTRVLLVDQWVETGGTMDAGIRLVERQGGVIAGIATVCIEEKDGGAVYRGRYRCSTAVIPGTAEQEQCNRKTMDHFADFDPACYSRRLASLRSRSARRDTTGRRFDGARGWNFRETLLSRTLARPHPEDHSLMWASRQDADRGLCAAGVDRYRRSESRLGLPALLIFATHAPTSFRSA